MVDTNHDGCNTRGETLLFAVSSQSKLIRTAAPQPLGTDAVLELPWPARDRPVARDAFAGSSPVHTE
ncbi:hypothetical protein AB5J55_43845 [Streptomyces sp. R11]|uniref:Uncharacterized protein n=1 Tax=Streptomyces sp. R11 TaxID=3238625 RepID=A0AB39NDE2_9ACTN